MKYSSSAKAVILLSGAALAGLLLVGCERPSVQSESRETAQAHGGAAKPPAGGTESAPAVQQQVELVHVHGLAYSPDGSQIMIPSHVGLALFNGSGWSKAPGPQHDYMGFSATRNALYSSGHPAPGSGMVNPFGLIKSTDGGQTWQKLGLEGESDFHYLATSYETDAVYVVNFHENSKMKHAGIYSTKNDGFSWQHAASRGLDGMPSSIAVHPTDPDRVAVGTKNGLYLSENGANGFTKIFEHSVFAVFFDLDGKHLWFSTLDGEQPILVKVALSGDKADQIALPPLPKDAVAYIAQNPVKKNEYAVATFGRSVYVSPDAGKSWKQIAQNGTTL